MCITVHGEEKAFNIIGHRPIFVGYDSEGNALYVAVVELEDHWAFTCVTDGASTATYVNRLGTQITNDFKVMVLRYDPCDVHLNELAFPCPPEEIVDPTGYLFWKTVSVDFELVRQSGLNEELLEELNERVYMNNESGFLDDELE